MYASSLPAGSASSRTGRSPRAAHAARAEEVAAAAALLLPRHRRCRCRRRRRRPTAGGRRRRRSGPCAAPAPGAPRTATRSASAQPRTTIRTAQRFISARAIRDFARVASCGAKSAGALSSSSPPRRSASRTMSTPGSDGKPAISSRIMGLKFMQKHKAKEEASKAAEALGAWRRSGRPSRRAAAAANSGAAPSSALPAAALCVRAGRPPRDRRRAAAGARDRRRRRRAARVVVDAAGLPAGAASFGKFNPRLEKGLAEIESEEALRERLAAEASARRRGRSARPPGRRRGARRGAASANGGRPRNGRALFQVPAGSARSGKASEAA